MDEEQFCEEPQRHEYVEIAEIFPANPIYDKPAPKQTKPQLRIEFIKNEITYKQPVRPVMKKYSQPEEEFTAEEGNTPGSSQSAFDSFFPGCKCLYRRYNNTSLNRYKLTKYFASCYIERRYLQQNKQELRSYKQLLALAPHDDTNLVEVGGRDVQFDSDFQSGNLFSAFKVLLVVMQRSPTEYDLVLQNDINTRGNTQWFYFTVSNLPLNVEITFNIVNLMKSDSLFNYGMQPVVFSQAKYKKNKQSWQRMGKVVGYTRNSIRRENSRRYYYTLTFKLTNKIAGDRLHIAHCYPYTYTMLEDFLKSLIKGNSRKGLKLERTTIGKSVGGIPIESLSVSETNQLPDHQKKIIVVLARQHPGESQGSFVCEGLINYLLGRSKEACFLRRHFIFKIIPMVNPDGVIMGNYRTNLSGCDLNRKWDSADRRSVFPEVACIKHYIAEINRSKKVKVVLDLHGHSKKLSSFFYGNPYPQQPEHVRGFPFICSKLSDKVSFEDCTFTIEEQKKRAARVFLSLAHQITHIYTFESSFFGYVKDGKRVAFSADDFRQLGATLLNGLYGFLSFEIAQEQKQLSIFPEAVLYQRYLGELRNDPNLMMTGDQKQSGSESHPEEFEIDLAQLTISPEKKQRTEQDSPDQQSKRGSSAKRILQPESPTQLGRRQHCSVPKVSSNNPSSRRSNRNIKDTSKHRRLKVLEISRVNSMLPDRYHLGLEPFNASTVIQQPPPHELERSTLHNRSMRVPIQLCKQTQTDPLRKQEWVMFRERDLYREGELPQGRSSRFTTKYRQFEIKYVSLTTSKCKKNLMLKLDFITRPPEPMYIAKARTNNDATQTILNGVKPNLEQIKLVKHHHSFDSSSTERLNAKVEDSEITTNHNDEPLKSVRLSLKRDTPEPFNEVIKKSLAKSEKHHGANAGKLGHSDESLFKKPTANEITQALISQKPLIIRKKEIIFQRKPSASKERP